MSQSSETALRTSKSQRINLRASERQEELLRRAATATDTSMSEFILGSAVDQAEKVLADRRWFTVSQEQWDEFNRLLDAPLEDTSKLRRLAARSSPFSDFESE
ncbi:DUF1778 domain-containing protein [Rhodococcus sp. IEGM 1408]|uniref:type II toxin-antitoxin system TacA family antitoxin n=1 Tax=Rhodococcus sp. IEGM 1408 TaxID=3082220 RepID=UPI0029547681|nr:DUF1778 domain-containing protein [Rhodococcus sp. IEGM 1408]MDV8001556.1 DUF1778 domain-containing protein [Rhodococcus sp. IEGM 1408]